MRVPCLFQCFFCAPEPEDPRDAPRKTTKALAKAAAKAEKAEQPRNGSSTATPKAAPTARSAAAAAGGAASKYLVPSGPNTEGLRDAGLDKHAEAIDAETKQQDAALAAVMAGLEQLKAGALVRQGLYVL